MNHTTLPTEEILSNQETEVSCKTLDKPLKTEIDHWLSKYPANQRQSALIPSLLIAQRYHQGWLPKALIDSVADYIQVSRMAAYEVATFYSMLELKPVGRCKISVCTNISCLLNGSEQIVQHLEKKLGIKLGETTVDQRVTLREVECLGACIRAPVMLVNGKYHENLTPEKIEDLLQHINQD